MLLLAIVLASTLAGPLAAQEDQAPDDQATADDKGGPPANCVGQSWLRNPEPYELGDLSALSPWTIYMVAEGHDPMLLEYEATPMWLPATPHWVGVGPLNLGPVVMLSVRPRLPGGAVYYIKAWQGTDCAVMGIYVPRDHGYGQ